MWSLEKQKPHLSLSKIGGTLSGHSTLITKSLGSEVAPPLPPGLHCYVLPISAESGFWAPSGQLSALHGTETPPFLPPTPACLSWPGVQVSEVLTPSMSC